jgi:transposase
MIDEVLTITAVSIQVDPCCPLCGTPALRVHRRYTRQITDLPCSGQQVRLLVQVRKCFCQVPGCARKIFLERLTPFVEPWARVTRRLYQIVQILGLATGGRLGIRVTDRMADTDVASHHSAADLGVADRASWESSTVWHR